MTVASEQKATTGAPCTVPTAASIPESSSGVISSSEPSSSRAVSRSTGLRGSSSRGSFAGLAGGASWVAVMLSTLPKATATLAPPKPKELLSAAMSPTGRSRGLVAMSSSTCGSRSSRLIVGGTTRLTIARIVATASSAPAPPSRWPVIDLVLVTTTWSTWEPSVAWSISPSAMSPCGVDVACALTWKIDSGPISDSFSARRIAREPPRPSGSGWAMSWESAVMPAPSTSA